LDDRLKRRDSKFPTFWQVQIVGWSCFYLSAVVSSLPLLKSGGVWHGSAFVIATFAASCLLRPLCRSLIRRRSLSWIALEVRAFAWCLPTGILAAYAVGLLTDRRSPAWEDWLETSVQAAFILFVWCSLYFSLKLWQQSVREQERLLRAESEVRDARLNALRFQLNPHFLFNSLNAVSTLVLEGDAPAATRMLSQIAEFLRTILDGEAMTQTQLSREVLYARQYLAIEQTRLGDRLRVTTSIAPETLQALVPTMLLQPLVENAVRHGVAPLIEGGEIRIASEVHGAKLKIIVWNSGRAPTLPRSDDGAGGIGLSNTAERLQTLYGSDYTFTLQSVDSGGCEARIELPIRFATPASVRLECAR
jgi:two-component system, LytTR family, sensor kinase